MRILLKESGLRLVFEIVDSPSIQTSRASREPHLLNTEEWRALSIIPNHIAILAKIRLVAKFT